MIVSSGCPGGGAGAEVQEVQKGAWLPALVPFWKPPKSTERTTRIAISNTIHSRQPPARDRGQRRRSRRPNSQQQVYILAQQKIQTAAQQSPLLAEAQKNTAGMLDGMLTSLGFQHVTVTFGGLR